MDLRNRNQNRSDDKETQFIPVQDVMKSSDKYDTQELSAAEIRRRAQQERPAQPTNAGYSNGNNGYYPQNPQGYSMPPQQNQGFAVPPQNQGYVGPNSQKRYSVPQQNTGYTMPRQNQGYNQEYGVPPQNQGCRMPNQNQGYGAPPQNQGYSVPPQNQGYNNVPPHPPVYPQQNVQRNTAPVQQRPPQRSSAPAKKKSSGRPMWQTVLRIVLSFIIIVFLVYSAFALVGIFRANIHITGTRSRTADAVSSEYVDNILIIGTDSRDVEEDRGRSDSMILLSINSETKTIHMTSFLRDVYVYINDEYGYNKLNAAFSYGGPELLMDTIESNYSVRIDDYVIVSFAACAAVIDAVGGVEITLSDDEANALNDILISEVNELMGDGRNDDLLESGGTYTLNGKQAMSYSRIRYVGNADFERTSRQREVLSLAMKKACVNPVAICSIFSNALPEISTNIPGLSLYAYSLKAPFLIMGYDVEQQQIPADDTFYTDTINGQSVLVTDFTKNHTVLLRTVFKDAL